MDLVKSVSIANMVNQRVAVIERIDAALKMLQEAREIADRAHVGFPYFQVSRHYYHRGGSSFGLEVDAEGARREIRNIVDVAAWQYLMSESGLMTFMDAKARERWKDELDKQDVPELTPENVEATFAAMYGQRGDMLERGVIECFKGLSWDYHTNVPQRFGKRIVLQGVRGWYSRAADKLDDLNRVFCLFDGVPEPDHRDAPGHKTESAAREKSHGVMDFPYFSVRWFKNGNCHLTFTRLEFVERMNQIIAKHYPGALPAEIR